MLRASIPIPARCSATDHRCRASRASAPRIPASGPSSCEAFCDQLVADRAAIADQNPELTTILVFISIADWNCRELSLIEQNHQPVTCLYAEIVFVIASWLRDFRSVDIRDPDLQAFKPDSVTIDNAGAPDHAANGKAVGRPRFGACRAKRPVDA